MILNNSPSYRKYMIHDILEKIKRFVLDPVSAFRKARDDDAVPVMSYFFILLVFFSILSGLVSAMGVMKNPIPYMIKSDLVASDPLVTFIVVFFAVLIAYLFFVLIWGLWLHLWTYVVGGRKGVLSTEKSVVYASTPYLLIGWIPVIGPVIGLIWSIILQVIGLRELHEITTTKAVLAMGLAVVIILIVMSILIGWLLIATISGVPVSSIGPY